MTNRFKAKQINDLKQEDLADALIALSSEGYTEWQLFGQQDRVDFIFDLGGRGERVVGRHVVTELYFVLAWGHVDEEE